MEEVKEEPEPVRDYEDWGQGGRYIKLSVRVSAGVKAKRYYVPVRAVDPNGLEGIETSVKKFAADRSSTGYGKRRNA